jgi:hypothetical protein
LGGKVRERCRGYSRPAQTLFEIPTRSVPVEQLGKYGDILGEDLYIFFILVLP